MLIGFDFYHKSKIMAGTEMFRMLRTVNEIKELTVNMETLELKKSLYDSFYY